MSSQRYERVRSRPPPITPFVAKHVENRTPIANLPSAQVAGNDHDDHANAQTLTIPNSPPPSFRSRASSRRVSHEDEHPSEEVRDLEDAFGALSDEQSDDEDLSDRRRLITGDRPRSLSPTDGEAALEAGGLRRPQAPQLANTQIPVFTPSVASSGRVMGTGSNDGVWANLNAKPRPGEDVEEKPPTYEQAAADATPPYWETTVLSPYSMTGNPDDVFVDGLLVGSLFSFIWNALISMSFQLIGFLLTYLLHTTHAAKNGSRAGLGITLVQYGFQMRYTASRNSGDPNAAPVEGIPDDPNSHEFDPSHVGGAEGPGGSGGITTGAWLSYVLMIVGWFILIRAVSDFMRARRQEQLIRSSPDRGLGVAVVAEGESPETSA
ncbi:hypothetical protein M433DRAFT_149935 [Acidomyces richmondensis BFW]|nr:MAG: hypothetical protein FE78DRAFT_93173 [Acidomyces sp. 'richmondensis']KYG49522.1 hypothetical protein M433DRAFT_149935 [Acidomyces richmondensis BFW]